MAKKLGLRAALAAILLAWNEGDLTEEAAMVAVDIAQDCYLGGGRVLTGHHSGFQVELNVECSMDEWWMDAIFPILATYGYDSDPWTDSAIT